MTEPVTFVSLGPGDPGLITLKGLKALQQADIIFCPATLLSDGQSSSRAKDILSDLEVKAEKISSFNLSMNKDRVKAIEVYNDISEQIIEHNSHALRVVVVAEGDSGFYSSVHYISDNLQEANIPVKKIAGIPAFIACAALAGIHIAKQEEELEIIPGTITKERLIESLNNGKTVVIMKPSQCEEMIKEMIHETQNVTFHYFENAGIPQKEFYTSDVNDIISRKFPYFSLFIIRKQYK
jgi:precorrin-2/cobalt-factor-2 C20-methyltransferase